MVHRRKNFCKGIALAILFSGALTIGADVFPALPAALGVQDIQIKQLRLNGDELYMNYAKNIPDCLEFVKEGGDFIRPQQVWLCTSGQSVHSTFSMDRAFSNQTPFDKGDMVKICTEGDVNKCSAPIAVTGNGRNFLPPPKPERTQGSKRISLYSAVLRGEELTLDYESTFATCAHVWKAGRKLPKSRNPFCAIDERKTLTKSFSDFLTKPYPALGRRYVRLCGGGIDTNVCSAEILVREEAPPPAPPQVPNGIQTVTAPPVVPPTPPAPPVVPPAPPPVPVTPPEPECSASKPCVQPPCALFCRKNAAGECISTCPVIGCQNGKCVQTQAEQACPLEAVSRFCPAPPPPAPPPPAPPPVSPPVVPPAPPPVAPPPAPPTGPLPKPPAIKRSMVVPETGILNLLYAVRNDEPMKLYDEEGPIEGVKYWINGYGDTLVKFLTPEQLGRTLEKGDLVRLCYPRVFPQRCSPYATVDNPGDPLPEPESSLELLWPKGGETLVEKVDYKIKYAYEGVDHLLIEVSYDDGASWTGLATVGTNSNLKQAETDWYPTRISQTTRLRLTEMERDANGWPQRKGDGLRDESSTFKIVPNLHNPPTAGPRISLGEPQSGRNWRAATYSIIWTPFEINKSEAQYSVELSLDGGLNWELLGQTTQEYFNIEIVTDVARCQQKAAGRSDAATMCAERTYPFLWRTVQTDTGEEDQHIDALYSKRAVVRVRHTGLNVFANTAGVFTIGYQNGTNPPNPPAPPVAPPSTVHPPIQQHFYVDLEDALAVTITRNVAFSYSKNFPASPELYTRTGKLENVPADLFKKEGERIIVFLPQDRTVKAGTEFQLCYPGSKTLCSAFVKTRAPTTITQPPVTPPPTTGPVYTPNVHCTDQRVVTGPAAQRFKRIVELTTNKELLNCVLYALVKDPSVDVRTMAARGLHESFPVDKLTTDALIYRLKIEIEKRVIKELVTALIARKDTASTDALIRFVTNNGGGDKVEYVLVVDELVLREPKARMQEALLWVVKHHFSIEARARAVWQLRHFDLGALQNTLLEQLKGNQHKYVKLEILRRYEQIPNSVTTPVFIEYISDQDLVLRDTAVRALKYHDTTAASAALDAYARREGDPFKLDDDAFVSLAHHLNTTADSLLINHIKETDDPGAFVKKLNALEGRVLSTQMRSALEEKMKNRKFTYYLRRKIADFLGLELDEQDPADLQRAFDLLGSVHAIYRMEGIRAMSQFTHPLSTRRISKQLLDDRDAKVRMLAAVALTNRDLPEALDALDVTARKPSEDWRVLVGVGQALGTMDKPKAAEALKHLIVSYSHQEITVMAAKGLVRHTNAEALRIIEELKLIVTDQRVLDILNGQ